MIIQVAYIMLTSWVRPTDLGLVVVVDAGTGGKRKEQLPVSQIVEMAYLVCVVPHAYVYDYGFYGCYIEIQYECLYYWVMQYVYVLCFILEL